jgi:membrane-bound ClpP family serine protease
MVSDPNTAILLIALGVLAIYVELCRPGRVVPGVFGGVILLVGFASLVNAPPNARISWPLVAILLVPLGAVSAFLLKVAIRARRNKTLR